MKNFILSWLLITAMLAPSLAQALPKTNTQDLLEQKGPQQTAEFIFRNSPRDNLITIQVFGSVNRPGVYYVPEDTDLMRLLTLAGGVVNTTELDEVVVRKVDGKAWKGMDENFVEQVNSTTYSVNVDKLLKKAVTIRPLKMNHDDFVYIPLKEPWISNNTAKVVTLGGVILTGVLTFFLIKKNDK